ncbi:two-component system histidine kinase PnpS [Clostridium sp. MT-14]|uniref:histidine kinase n=1 Tax=Clostridium aromativorans TaxID=2836848 RepID=A0ABS8N7G4_9CLOT|nr:MULTISPECIES: ATP-binding protein [Clostridium]KAA8677025.1 cell wall metabolism sensor histidine kinase WalK [Clostridium sp. HV4-5-A1G]MCC9294693.1 cell wall metabolism sensor histidine kinase WalK [Clostridium aromativorans]CAB1243515.1 Phosphate regulon sensor protein PhoR [Clostridiaceae bacterium BL-3]
MKRKLMLSMLVTLIFSMLITTLLFIIIENREYIENMKQTLKLNNQIIINVIQNKLPEDISSFSTKNFKNAIIRETFIDKKGKVLSDSVASKESMGNHNSRKEVQEARKNGTGYDVRLSDTTGKKTLYFATAFGDGYIMRSALTMQTIKGLEGNYFKYYVLIMFFSVLVSMMFSEKLSKSIVSPIEKLQRTTSSIAGGNFDNRVKINSDDEIGQLAITFNNMADKLQITLEDLVDKRNKLEAILKSMDNGVIAVDMDYKIIMINPYAERIFGVHKNIIGKDLLDGIRDFELEDIFKDEEDDYREIKILWPRERILRIKRAFIINGREKIGKVAVVQDITDIKKLENMRSQFVANVSHELKTPLTSIKGFAETLKYVEDEEDKNKFLNIINDEANRLTRLINDILTLSHIENSKMDKSEIIETNNIIEDICCMVEASADKKHIVIKKQLCKPPGIWGDPDRFKQMIINLVDNAIKYTDNGGRVSINTDVRDNNYLISVEDNGVGISKVHQKKLFERFYRVDKARSRSAGGTGLGLAIVKHIVLAFNGTIELKSEIGEGSKFTVKIPIDLNKNLST